ncbi:MAG: hypothetical protein WAT92_25125 [Saprospiraceae bacterium]
MLTPNDKLSFGKNKGVELKLVYKFQPSYIEWAILNIPSFIINILEFEKLPNPTPFHYNKDAFASEPPKIVDNNFSDEEFWKLLEMSDTANQVKEVNSKVIQEISEKEILPEIEYKFPERVRNINQKKIENTFKENIDI